MSRKKRNRDRRQLPRPAIIDIQPNETTTTEAVGAEVAAHSVADDAPETTVTDGSAEKPVLECSIVAHQDKLTLEGVDEEVAEVISGKSFGRNVTEVRFKSTKATAFKVISPIAKAQIHAAAKTWVGKWLARIGALALWAIFVTFVFGEVGMVGWLLERIGVSASWEAVILIALVAALVLFSSMTSVGGTTKVLLYVLFSPFVIAFVAISKIADAFLVVGRVVAFLSSLRATAGIVLTMIVASVVISKASDQGLLWLAIVLLAIGCLFLIVSNFLWAASPLHSLFRLLSWLELQARASMNNFRKELPPLIATASKGGKDAEKAIADLAKLFGKTKGWAWGAKLVETRLRQFFAPIALFHLFALRFLVSLSLILLAFGGFYLAIAKMDPAAFGGTAGIKTFGDGVYFSVGTFFTSSYGDVIPVSVMAKWTVVCQIGIALAMLTLLALSFSTLGIQRTTDSSAEIEVKATEFLRELEKQLSRHYAFTNRNIRDVLADLVKNPRAYRRGW